MSSSNLESNDNIKIEDNQNEVTIKTIEQENQNPNPNQNQNQTEENKNEILTTLVGITEKSLALPIVDEIVTPIANTTKTEQQIEKPSEVIAAKETTTITTIDNQTIPKKADNIDIKQQQKEDIVDNSFAVVDPPVIVTIATKMELNSNINEQQQQQPQQQVVNGENINGNQPIAKIQQHQQLEQQQPMHPLQMQPNKGQMDADASLTNFKVLYVVTQLCGLTMIVLVGCWIGIHMGGFAGTSNPRLEFNWHPLLMTIGLIFLYGNSILVYRGFRNTKKKTLKITHASIHMGAFVLTVIALKTAFDSHNLLPNPIPNMYSLHSWLGLAAVILFSLQYVSGFMAYLVPGLKENYKIALMPMHIYFGIFGFVLAIASALMGITEKAIFSINNYSSLPNAGVMANVIGVLYVIFGGLVVYLVTETSYKRKPIPEDTVLLTGANE